MNKNRRKTALILIVVLAILGIAASTTLVMARVENAKPLAARAAGSVLPVETVKPVRQIAFKRHRAFSGRAQARRESALGFEIAGRLAQVRVETGQRVAAGDELAALDTARLQSRRTELNAALAEAEARLALARATLRRNRGVVDAGAISRQALDEAQQTEHVAKAGVELAARRIGSLEIELVKSRLHAPFSGTIVARMADEGRVLGSGEPVLRLQEDSVPEVRIGVAGHAVEQLVPGETYSLSWQGREVPARLRALLPMRAAVARTVEALFDPLDANPSMRSGDTVTLKLHQQVEKAGIWLPADALTEGERGLWSVYVLQPLGDSAGSQGATHQIVRRTVDLVHQEADRVYVQGALRDIDRIVGGGPQRVVPGQQVRTL